MGFRASAPTLFIVATPIGNLEDVTARAVRVLGEVAVIAAEDTRRTAHLLARYGIQTPMTSLHEHNEDKKTIPLIARLQGGDSVALVSDAGTPTVSDPGERLIRAAIAAGIRVESVPGPSAPIAALAASGLSTGTFTFMGFPPIRSKDRSKWFERIRAVGGTIVFFEAPHRIRATLEQLQAVAGDCQVCVARELTKTHEELVRGPISTALTALESPRGEFTVVADIGQTTDNEPLKVASDDELLRELGDITKTRGLKRRQAVAALARKYSRTVNDIYDSIERAKESGK